MSVDETYHIKLLSLFVEQRLAVRHRRPDPYLHVKLGKLQFIKHAFCFPGQRGSGLVNLDQAGVHSSLQHTPHKLAPHIQGSRLILPGEPDLPGLIVELKHQRVGLLYHLSQGYCQLLRLLPHPDVGCLLKRDNRRGCSYTPRLPALDHVVDP